MYIPFAPKLYLHEKKRSHIVHEGTNADTITNCTNSCARKKKKQRILLEKERKRKDKISDIKIGPSY